MIRFNYIIGILGIVGQFVAIYPRNAVMQDIFFGIFCMGAGMIGLAHSQKLSEKLGICPEVPLDKAMEKKSIIVEIIILVLAALLEVILFLLHLPYTYTTTVVAAVAIVWLSRTWRGRYDGTKGN